MYPHPVLSEWQIEEFYADAARRAAPCRSSRSSADVPLLDRLGRLSQALRGRLTPRAFRSEAAADARVCPHASA